MSPDPKPVLMSGATALFFHVMALGAALWLAGCSQLMESGANRNKGAAMTQASYAAADMLIHQARGTLGPQAALEVAALEDLDNPGETTNFGRMAAEQIASRLVQLGYNISAPGAAPPAAASGERRFITGRYAAARQGVLVNLRIVDAAAGNVIAAYDYSVPLTPDVRELLKTREDRESFFDF